MDLVNYHGERFGVAPPPACQPTWCPVGACRTLPGGALPAQAGQLPGEPSVSGRSLVTLWFVTRNTVCSLETT